jgi:hypothetical protein
VAEVTDGGSGANGFTNGGTGKTGTNREKAEIREDAETR